MSAFHRPAFDGAAFAAAPVVVTLPIAVDVSALQAPVLPVQVSVVPAAIAGGTETVADGGSTSAAWRLVVEVGGVDVSDSVIGEVTVEAEESAARVADLALHQPAGTVVTPTDWIGASVNIWLAAAGTGVPVDAVLVFAGLVDTPVIAPGSRRIGLRCTDNRQGMLAAMSRQQVGDLVFGYYSDAVFDPGAPSLTHAGDLLSTIPYALDVRPGGGLRMTPWAAKTTPDLSFGENDVLDQSVQYDPPDRGGLTNRVGIRFGYRFPRQKCEGYSIGYDRLALDMTSFGQWVKDGNYILQREAVKAAIEQAGAAIVDITWRELPTHAVKLPGVGDAYWIPNPALHGLLCMGFAAVVSFDFNQEQTESFVLTVENAASIARVGVVAEEMSGALEGVWDDPTAAEHAVLLWKKKITTIPPRSTAPVSVGFINAIDAELTPDTDRNAANDALVTLIAIARTKIAAAHRRHAVQAAVPANPALDLDKTVAIDAAGVTAQGKVRHLRHRFDTDRGEAITEFTLAVSSVAGIGFSHPDSDIVAPDGTAAGAGTAVDAVDINWNGLIGQDNVITVSFPGVFDGERNNAETEIAQRYDAPVAEDILEITL